MGPITKRRPLAWFAGVMRATYEPGRDDPWWYDNTAHAASGAIIGALAHSALALAPVACVLAFLVCALVWEWFEYAYNIRPWDGREEWSYDRAIEDTILDTVMGLIGVWLAVVAF